MNYLWWILIASLTAAIILGAAAICQYRSMRHHLKRYRQDCVDRGDAAIGVMEVLREAAQEVNTHHVYCAADILEACQKTVKASRTYDDQYRNSIRKLLNLSR